MKKLSKLSLHEMTNGMRVMTPEQEMYIQGGGGDTSWWSEKVSESQYLMKGPDGNYVYSSDIYGLGAQGYTPVGGDELSKWDLSNLIFTLTITKI